MCGKNFTFWYCAFLFLVILSSKSQQNSTNNGKKNDNLTVRYELDANSTTNYDYKMKTLRYDLYEKSINNTRIGYYPTLNNTQYDNRNRQYESQTTFTNNDREDDEAIQYELGMHFIQNHVDDKQIPMKFRTNLKNTNHKRNFTSHEIYGNLMSIKDKNDSLSHEFYENSNKDSNINNIIPYKMCYNITCIQLCCPPGDRLVNDTKCIPEQNKYLLPHVYGYTNNSLYSALQKALRENKRVDELFQLTIYDPCQKINRFSVSFHIVSISFLVLIFLVYSILPELRNTHGFLLRNYSAALSIAYTIHIVVLLISADDVCYSVCISIAFFNYLCYLASLFWLNVMSFDMWWTFRGFCSLQRNIRQQNKRKLVFYTIFAWGLPFIFAIISVIMDFISENLPEILQPGFREGDCWFYGRGTFALYYYGFKSICVISSICLSISTTLKIMHYEKKTGNRLTDSESKRYNDNKKWFNLYLKLFITQFIVLGIKWSVTTASWLSEDITSNYVLYITNLMDIIQNLCTFVIFVWKKKIKQLLLKRFGCGPENRCTRNTISSITSTCITTLEVIPMQEKRSSCEQGNCHAKSSSHGTEL